MRDNGNGVSSGAAHIRPVHWTRTEHQLASHESFAPGYIETREPVSLSTSGERTMQLAVPPDWTHRDDLPCVKRVPTGNAEDPFDTNDPKRARALCAGCPVRRACLDDALAEEGDLGERARWLVRGGLTPKERAKQAECIARND